MEDPSTVPSRLTSETVIEVMRGDVDLAKNDALYECEVLIAIPTRSGLISP